MCGHALTLTQEGAARGAGPSVTVSRGPPRFREVPGVVGGRAEAAGGKRVMNRRTFLTTVGVCIVAAPIMGEGQQVGKVWRVGVLTTDPRPAPDSMHPYNAFTKEQRELGYGEGQNLVFEWRYSDGNDSRRRQEAAAIVGWKPDVILVSSGADAIAFRDLTKTLPIVVVAGRDLVLMGLAASVPRPGGNVTGLQILQPELAIKKLQLMTELIPGLQRLAVLDIPPAGGATNTNYDRVFSSLKPRPELWRFKLFVSRWRLHPTTWTRRWSR